VSFKAPCDESWVCLERSGIYTPSKPKSGVLERTAREGSEVPNLRGLIECSAHEVR
jgi:hypothetical protein